MTAPVLNNIPLPEWTSEEIADVAEYAAELSRKEGVNTIPGGQSLDLGESCQDLDRQEIRAQIESVVANGFELERNDIDTVLRDFSQKACSDSLRDRIRELIERDDD